MLQNPIPMNQWDHRDVEPGTMNLIAEHTLQLRGLG